MKQGMQTSKEEKGLYSNILKESNSVNKIQVDSSLAKPVGFGYPQIVKDKDGRIKEVRLSPHKHSYTDLNLQRFESPSSTSRNDEHRGHSNRVSTPTFHQSRKANGRNYPKLYDELYAASFQYPEQEDPVLERMEQEEKQSLEDEQPFQANQENFVSFASNMNFKKEVVINNYIPQDVNKTKFFGDLFVKKDHQNEAKNSSVVGSENYIPTSEELKNSLSASNSKILFVPLQSQINQTPQTKLVQGLLQENQNALNSQSNSSLSSQYILSKPISHKQILNYKESQIIQQQFPLTSNLFTENVTPSYQKADIDITKTYQPLLSTTGASTAFTTSTITATTSTTANVLSFNPKNVNVQQYLKQNNIPDYKPLTNQQSSLSLSTINTNTCQTQMSRTTFSPSPSNLTLSDIYKPKSYLNTQPSSELESTSRFRTSGNEKREFQPNQFSYIKI